MINRRHVLAVGLSNDGGRGGPACQALAVGILRAL